MKLPNLAHHKTLGECVYEEIYTRIVNGELLPNDRITESKIARSMKISRGPVREALVHLAEDELIEMVPRSGYFVAQLSIEDAIELFEIRKRLEILALEWSFDTFERNKLENLETDLEKCLSLNSPDITPRALELDFLLHRLIHTSSQRKGIAKILNKLWARIRVFIIRNAAYIDYVKMGIEQHRAIVKAILEKDLESSIKLLSEHIECAKKELITELTPAHFTSRKTLFDSAESVSWAQDTANVNPF